MLLYHCADLHLDSKMESNLPMEKAKERQEELVDTFAKMVTDAIKNEAKVILIAGDLFDTSNTKFKNIKKRIVYILEQYPQIDFLYLKGNHDDDDYFYDFDKIPENLKFFSKDKWISYTYDDVCITGRVLSDNVSDSIYDELVLDRDKINIVTLHGQVTKATNKKDAPLINLKRLSNKNIDYLALGHIHSYSKDNLDARGIYGYSGCLEGRGFDETGDKGFVKVEITNHELNTKFVPIAKRNLYVVQVDISNIESFSDILNKIKDETSGIDEKNLVKVELVGEVTEDTDIDVELFTSEMKKDFYFIKIEDKTQRKIDYEKYRNEISLKGEFVRVVEAENIPENEKADIIITGLKALAGKELK